MKNKKIAIMTWYTYNNYGSVLQAYALRKTIEKLGPEKVDIIQYTPKPERISFFKRITLKRIQEKLLLKNYYNKELVKEKEKKFIDFREKYFSFSDKCDNSTELFKLNDEYDKFVCGSDQIWAPTVFDENYFLDFVNNNDKKTAYAPSIGLPSVKNAIIQEQMSRLINRIEFLSIREKKGQEIIKEISGRNAKVVLDPTLLLDKNDWSMLTDFKKEYKRYAVYYCLKSNNNHFKVAKKISKILGMDLKVIPAEIIDYKKNNIENCSPKEFIELIYNASLVFTDSYHGIVLSINFNIPFIAFKRFKDNILSQNSRIYHILNMTNLENRIYNNNFNYFINNIEIDFSKVNNIIQKNREESILFLKNALNKQNNKEEMTIITNRCVGCGICQLSCPAQCIDIKLNENGFYHYFIDESKCIKCNKCKNVCGQYSSESNDIKNMDLYSAFSRDKNTLMSSSSGGFAHEISKWGIENGFDIIGCVYDIENGIVKHIKVNKEEDIKKFDGSKYLQSFTRDGFQQINEMNKGIVIGTPCQIASVDKYLKILNKRNSFILIDLICHGVPSKYVWDKYISEYNNISSVRFRDKKFGWQNLTISINSSNHHNEKKDYFYQVFNSGKTFDKSCYDCKYRTKTSADIRIGDFWGEKFKNNQKGVSMVITASNVRRKNNKGIKEFK